MSTTRIKNRKPAAVLAARTTNPLLFQLPLAKLQHWILRHSEFDPVAIAAGYKTIKALVGDNNTDVIFAASVVVAQYFADMGEDLNQNSDCYRSFEDGEFGSILNVTEEDMTIRDATTAGVSID